MEVKVNNTTVKLQKKERKIGGEAPAIRIKMRSGETKVIGMMADKVQVFVTLPYKDSLSVELAKIIEKYSADSLIYLISSERLDKNVDLENSSVEFKELAMKLGVYVDDTLCAKSIFIINKDGEFVYIEILADLVSEFDLGAFDKALDDAIKFKKKGHIHENWMGA